VNDPASGSGAAINPEIAHSILTGSFKTNYHDLGSSRDTPVPALFVHGSGPGVSAWANWRLVLPLMSAHRRVIAPDMLGFGYTDRPDHAQYRMVAWIQQLLDLLDALEIEAVDLIGNSFGGALALAFAIEHPRRVRRIVLMGSVGVPFAITKGLDDVWGYTPSFENMRELMDVFAYDRRLVNDELARLRYHASIRPGFKSPLRRCFRRRASAGSTPWPAPNRRSGR